LPTASCEAARSLKPCCSACAPSALGAAMPFWWHALMDWGHGVGWGC
jgi:hypothetical protein